MHQSRGDPLESDTGVFLVGDLRVDLGQQRVTRAGIEIALPNLSFKMLLALVRAAPNILSNELLATRVWTGLVITPETVNKRVNLLREALGDNAHEPRYIVGVRSRGYRLIVAVAPEAAAVVPSTPSLPAVEAVAQSTDLLQHATSGDSHRTGTTRPQYVRWAGYAAAAVAMILAAAMGVRLVNQDRATAPEALDESMADSAPVAVRARTVAVLPFDNISPDAADAYLAQGVPEMILNRLSRINGLSVIARNSSFALTTKGIDSREIGRRLDSGYLVNGSVQRESDRLRVAVQLVDTAAGTQIWSAHFDRPLSDIFNVEDEVADQVADALSTRLGGVELKPLPKERSGNLDAYLSFLRGRTLLGRFTVAESEAAVPYFEKAIALDSRFASAYASLYDSRMQSASKSSEDLAPIRRRYEFLIDRALTIDPQSGAAYFARATWGDGSDAKAQDLRYTDFRRGLALDPSNGRGITAYAEFLLNDLARREEGMRMLQHALRIDPMSPRAHYMAAVKDSFGGGTKAMERGMLEILELDPNFVPALHRYAKLRWFFDGTLAESIQLIERAIALDPANPGLRNLAMAIYLDLDDKAAARDVANGTPKSAAAARLLLSLNQGNWRDAGLAAADGAGWAVGGGFENWEVGEALRDYAFKTGELNRGIALIRSDYHLAEGATNNLDLFNFRQAVYLSQLLAAQGQTKEALELRRAAAAWNDANEANYGHVFARRVRAAILLLDGNADAALTELAGSFQSKDYVHWWYTIKYDPLWLPLHNDPRFQAIAADVRRYVDAQRNELETLRRHGNVPRRGSSAVPN